MKMTALIVTQLCICLKTITGECHFLLDILWLEL